MKVKASKKSIFIAIAILIALLLVGTALGITGAYFGTKREISGQVNLSPGIRVDFTNDKDQVTIEYDEKTHEFWLRKYDVNSFAELNANSTISRFNLTEIRDGAEIAIVAPEMTSQTTDDFYIRAKVVLRDSVTAQELTDEQMEEIFGTTENPITFNDNWLLDENGEWSYLVETGKSSWTDGAANSNDILKVAQNDKITFFTTSTTAEDIEYVPLELETKTNFEHYSIAGFEVVLHLQAVEAAKVEEQFFS